LTSPIDNYFTNQTVVQQTWGTDAIDVSYYQYRSCRNNPTNEDCTVIYKDDNLSGKTRSVHNNNIAFWWQVRGIDKAGNIGEWSTPRKITIDTIAPDAPEIEYPSPESYFNSSPIRNEWTEVSDSSGIAFYRVWYVYDDGHTFSGGPYRTTTSTFRNHAPDIGEQGGVTISVQAVDNAGNESEWSNSIHYTYDETPPTTTITTPEENTLWSKPIDIEGYSTDNNGIYSVSLEYAPYYLVAGTGTCGNYVAIKTLTIFDYDSVKGRYNWSYENWTPTAEGSYCIKAYATDNAGNVEQTAEIKNVVYDITIPEITLTTNPTDPDGSNDWFKTKPTITLTATDSFDIDRVEYQWGSKTGSWTTYTSPFKPDSEGKLVLYYRSIDKAGNESVGVKNIKVDTDKPSSVSNVKATYNENENSITLDWDVEDSDIEEVRVYKGESSDFDTDSLNRISKQSADDENYTDKGDLDISISRGNTYHYKLVAIDSAGNRSNTKKVSIEIPEEGAPVVAIEEGVVEGVEAGEEEEGQVAGEETGPEGEGIVKGTEGEEGSVLGEETAKVSGKQSIFKSFWFWLILIVLGALIIWLINRKSENGAKTKKKYM
jgi:hypothetical protein